MYTLLAHGAIKYFLAGDMNQIKREFFAGALKPIFRMAYST